MIYPVRRNNISPTVSRICSNHHSNRDPTRASDWIVRLLFDQRLVVVLQYVAFDDHVMFMMLDYV